MNELENTNIVVLSENIKKDIVSTRNSLLRSANQELIAMYFRMGKSISENASYGNNFISALADSLRRAFPDATGYSPRNLARMKKFYEEYRDLANLPPVVANLPWTHNYLLVEKVKDLNKRLWYAEKSLENSWSKVVFDH